MRLGRANQTVRGKEMKIKAKAKVKSRSVKGTVRAYMRAAELVDERYTFACNAIRNNGIYTRDYNQFFVDLFSNWFNDKGVGDDSIGWWEDEEYCRDDKDSFFIQQTPRVIALCLMAELAKDGQLDLNQ